MRELAPMPRKGMRYVETSDYAPGVVLEVAEDQGIVRLLWTCTCNDCGGATTVNEWPIEEWRRRVRVDDR